MKIKEDKKAEREKRKQAVNTEDFIKKALRKGTSRKMAPGKGNHGTKNKVKQNNLEIRENMF